MIRRSMILALLSLVACDGAKAPAADSSAAAVPATAIQASQMPAPDTMKADTVKQNRADAAAKATVSPAAKDTTKPTKAVTPPSGFDRLRRPIGTIDEKTGKVDTIRKP